MQPAEVELLFDGPASYEAMLALIRGARAQVLFEMYIWRDTAPGDPEHPFARALAEKAAAGCTVCLLVDPAGSRGADRSVFDRLAAAGVKVLLYNPLSPLRARAGWRPDQRDHRKLLVVDGEVAVLGGVDVSREYAARSYQALRQGEVRPQEAAWHDVDLRLRGPAVSELRRQFTRTWQQQAGGPLDDPGCTPEWAGGGNAGVAVYTASPGDAINRAHRALLQAIAATRGSILIANAYFIPDAELKAAIVAAARRGVEVRLLLPGVTDFRVALHAQRFQYDDLLRAGCRIFEMTGQMLHAKAAVFDAHTCAIGSYNMDRRSRYLAEEVLCFVESDRLSGQLLGLLEDDLRRARPIQLPDWRQRPIGERLLQLAVQPLRHWL